jgi:hypothetical protein
MIAKQTPENSIHQSKEIKKIRNDESSFPEKVYQEYTNPENKHNKQAKNTHVFNLFNLLFEQQKIKHLQAMH